MTKSNRTKFLAAAVSASAFAFFPGCGSGGANGSATLPSFNPNPPAQGPTNSCSVIGGSQYLAVASPLSAATGKSVAQKGMRVLAGHVPAATALAQDLGRVDDSKPLALTVALTLNNQAQLAQDLEDLYNPSSANYHRFMTPDEFRSKYGPTSGQIASVVDYLQQSGLSAVTVDDSQMLVHAVASAGDVGTAFGTEIHQFTSPQGRAFHAPTANPQIPNGLPISAVLGLQNLTVAHTHLQGPLQGPTKGTSTSRSGSGPNGGYAPVDFRTAYNVPSSLNGSGQTLGLFELDSYTASDVSAYEQQFGLAATPLQNVAVDGAGGTPGGGQAEVTLDIELMIAMAPNATKILVYEGPNSEQGMLDTYTKIASDNLAKSISTSWGSDEGSAGSSLMQAENTIFMQMAAQGQTIYAASGDSGADDNGSSLGVDDPGSQPYVTGTGGTSLVLGASSSYGSESTWDDSGGAGGGGISTVWTIPSWQKSIAGTQAATSKGSTTMRNVPDISLHADINNGYAIYEAGSWGVWGGTSCAAPLWAGMTALLNQARASNGLGTVGFINPSIYAIGESSRYASDFHDIADGSNNGFYPAVAGYDDATGWGSFNATQLIDDLSKSTPTVGGAPPPTAGCPATKG